MAFLIPAVLYVLFAFVVPIVYNLILSFEQTSPATISSLFAPFAGLSNYRATLTQSVTQSAIARTFIFTGLLAALPVHHRLQPGAAVQPAVPAAPRWPVR